MTESDNVQEEAGVNHIAAKIIDSISSKPGSHAAVGPVHFVSAICSIYRCLEDFLLVNKTVS